MTVAELCRMIEHAKHLLTLDELAHQAIMSPYHFHRVFKSLIGLTPRSYTVAQRIKRISQKLERSHPGTDAIYVASFNSNGRFYKTSNGVLGMPSSHYRAGGARRVIWFAVGECSLGSILVAQSLRGFCGILLGDDRDGLDA